MRKILILILVFSSFIFSKDLEFDSVYTDIHKNASFENIEVEVTTDDNRDFLTLIRESKRYDLALGTVITPLFRELGKKMEWRFPKGQKTNPTAMIVRLNITIEGQTQKDHRIDSYLIVSKITKDEICLVGKIAPQKNQNILARAMADKASTLPCLLDTKNNQRINP